MRDNVRQWRSPDTVSFSSKLASQASHTVAVELSFQSNIVRGMACKETYGNLRHVRPGSLGFLGCKIWACTCGSTYRYRFVKNASWHSYAWSCAAETFGKFGGCSFDIFYEKKCRYVFPVLRNIGLVGKESTDKWCQLVECGLTAHA